MWHGVTWLVMIFLLTLWSLGAWALHALVQWAAGLARPSESGGLSEVLGQAGTLRPPEWLAVWMPPGTQEWWDAMVSAVTPWIDDALTHVPGLLTWLSPAVWVAWALGAVLLLALGGGLSALIAMGQRQKSLRGLPSRR